MSLLCSKLKEDEGILCSTVEIFVVAEAKRTTYWHPMEPCLLRVWEGIKMDESLMSQQLLPGYDNICTMKRMIGDLKHKETKK